MMRLSEVQPQISMPWQIQLQDAVAGRGLEVQTFTQQELDSFSIQVDKHTKLPKPVGTVWAQVGCSVIPGMK